MVYPAEAALPGFIDSVLQYLSVNLPPPIYSFLVKLLSHSFAAITALTSLCNTLLTNAPENWNPQTLLPPIITLLAAYLALASIYRTTTWLLRLSLWFMKWGTLLGVFFGGVGYFLGNGAGNGVGNQGGGPGFGGLFASLLDDPRRTQKSRTSKSATSKNKGKKPKAWDSFERHQEWQHRHEQDQQAANDPLQQVLSTIGNTAASVLGGKWWEVAKNLAGNTETTSPDDASAKTSTKSKEKDKTKAGKTRSR